MRVEETFDAALEAAVVAPFVSVGWNIKQSTVVCCCSYITLCTGNEGRDLLGLNDMLGLLQLSV